METLRGTAAAMKGKSGAMSATDVADFIRSHKKGGSCVLPPEYFSGVASGQYTAAPCNQAAAFPLAADTARFAVPIKIPAAVDLSETLRLADIVKAPGQTGGSACTMCQEDRAKDVAHVMRKHGGVCVRVSRQAKAVASAYAEQLCRSLARSGAKNTKARRQAVQK